MPPDGTGERIAAGQRKFSDRFIRGPKKHIGLTRGASAEQGQP